MMKKEKLVLALLCLGSVAIAQSSVTLGTFGFAKDSAVNSGFHIASMQFFAGVSNSPVTLYGDSLPVGSTIYAFDKDLQEYAPSATYEAGYDASFNLVTNWSKPELLIEAGEGFWYKATVANIWTATRPYSEN